MEHWFIDFISGSMSGIFGTFAGHPLDTIKCRLQSNKKNYGSAIRALIQIIREEKIFGLYKGLTPAVVNQFPVNAILFSEYYRMYRFLDNKTRKDSKYNFITQNWKYFISGCYCGLVSIFINTPSELIKCRQQLCRTKVLSTRGVVKEIVISEGFLGLYRGLTATFNRDFFPYGIYFLVYNKLKHHFEEKNSLTSFKLMLAGGISGISSWFIAFPFDTLKTRIQIDRGIIHLSQLKVYYDIKLQTNSTIIGLFYGVTPALIRAFFVNAVIFYTNELCHNYFDRLLI